MRKPKSDKLADRWTQLQKDKACGIVNDIAEDIDNKETRAELRQALAIYADMLHDAIQEQFSEKDRKLIKKLDGFIKLISRNNS